MPTKEHLAQQLKDTLHRDLIWCKDWERVMQTVDQTVDKVLGIEKDPVSILGLCGSKGSGKDSFARLLVESDPRYMRVAFADELKRICQKVYGLTEEQCTDPALKESSLTFFSPASNLYSAGLNLDDKIDELRAETSLDIQPQGMVAQTPRQVLQFVGTEYVRAADPNYWVNFLFDKIVQPRYAEKRFVITDLRFENEANITREYGGLVLRILRVAKLGESRHDGHPSEALAFGPDYALGIMEGNWSLPRLIARDSVNGKLREQLARYDLHRSLVGNLNAELYYGEMLVNSHPLPRTLPASRSVGA